MSGFFPSWTRLGKAEAKSKRNVRPKSATRQYELPQAGLGGVFNLAGQTGDDPLRLERERWAEAQRQQEAKEFEARMQRSLAECPGFIGSDAPRGPLSVGKVVVEPGRITEAMPWLKRRFHVSENLELSTSQGLCVEIVPRLRSRRAGQAGARRVSFGKPEQFSFVFESGKTT